MKREDQTRFARELLASIGETIERALTQMPESWDGIEIRQLIADIADESAVKMDRERRSRYLGELIKINLKGV